MLSKIVPLAIPGGNPAHIGGIKAPGAPAIAPTGYKPAHMVKPNRRLGAKKSNRMAFTPPGKIGAFHNPSDPIEE